MMDRRTLLLAGIASPAAFALPAFPSRAASPPRRGGVLTAIVTPEPVTLTAAANTAAPTGFVSGNVFDGLLEYGPDLKPRPSLAERWTVAEDGLSITFHLRRSVTWHDGTPFTSADVKWTLENVWKKLHPRNQVTFEHVASVETPDDHTVVLRLAKPSLAILSSVNSNGAQILPKHLYEGTDVLANPYNQKPVGTGAFKFKEWVKGSHITLERNPNYWDAGKPYVDEIVFRIVPDAAARAGMLETGEAQYAAFSPVSLRDAERLGKLPNLRIETRGYEWISPFLYIDLNVESRYLKDPRVRRALAHAIDRDAMVKVVWYGFGKPAISPIPSTVAEFHDPSVPKYPFDPKMADALLDEAGFKRGADGIRFSLNHDFLPFGDDYRRSGEYLKQALRRVGIDLTLRSQDFSTWVRRIYKDRDFDISSSWGAAFSDPQVGVSRYYLSGWAGKGIPGTNGSGYANPEIDALVASAQVEPDQAKRVATFRQFQQIVQRDLPTIPLIELRFFSVHAARLNDAVATGDQVYGSLKNAWLSE
jgi:peptide/nickel transport system substrate-binding protein